MIADTRQDTAGHIYFDVFPLHSPIKRRPADFSALGKCAYCFPGTADVVMDKLVVFHVIIVSYFIH